MQVQGSTASVESLVRWLIEVKGLPPQRADVTGARPDGSWTAFTNQDIKAGEVGPNPLPAHFCAAGVQPIQTREGSELLRLAKPLSP